MIIKSQNVFDRLAMASKQMRSTKLITVDRTKISKLVIHSYLDLILKVEKINRNRAKSSKPRNVQRNREQVLVNTVTISDSKCIKVFQSNKLIKYPLFTALQVWAFSMRKIQMHLMQLFLQSEQLPVFHPLTTQPMHQISKNKIFEVLISYGLSYEQIRERVHFISDRGSQFKALNSVNRSNCVAHMVNNIVHKMCSESEIQKIIHDAVNLVRYMKRSRMNFRGKLA